MTWLLYILTNKFFELDTVLHTVQCVRHSLELQVSPAQRLLAMSGDTTPELDDYYIDPYAELPPTPPMQPSTISPTTPPKSDYSDYPFPRSIPAFLAQDCPICLSSVQRPCILDKCLRMFSAWALWSYS